MVELINTVKNKLDKRGNLYEPNNDIKAFAKAVIL